MRYLFIDANYQAFLNSVYAGHPGLASTPYDEQLATIHAGLFGEAAFQANALRALGHEAEVIVTNAYAAQRAWAREHGVASLARRRWRFRLRRGVVPWIASMSNQTNWEILFAQVREYRPDVLYVGIMDSMPAAVAAQLKTMTRLVVAQVATDLPRDCDYRAYGLVVSALPSLVEWFRDQGLESEWLPLAFGPEVLGSVPSAQRDVPASFIGSISYQHPGRRELLEAVAEASLPLQIWSADLGGIAADSVLRPMLHTPTWGRGMYEVLARSRMTLNQHGAIAGDYAANLRLYEATGMGSLLVTDAKSNLPKLFNVGTEVIAYRNPRECAELVSHYLDHPEEASKIAAAGQARTLRDHTWHNRMVELVGMVDRRL